MSMITIADRWDKFCHRIGMKDANLIEQMFEVLCESYGDRLYHNIFHAYDCVQVLGELLHIVNDRDCTEFVLWNHDSVYVPGRSDNEEQSCGFTAAMARMTGVKWLIHRIEKMNQMTLVTKHNDSAMTDDEMLICDIDLIGLSRSWERYKEVEQLIRKESGLGETDYFCGRAKFLYMMLDRPTIYYLDSFQGLNEKARWNLRREMADIPDQFKRQQAFDLPTRSES